MDSDGDDDPAAPAPESGAAAAVARGAPLRALFGERRGFDPSAPEFLPRGSAAFAAPDSGAKASTGGTSLIFGGGGDFLSKYSHVQGNREAGGHGARLRKKGELSTGLPANPGTSSASSVPDRVNVQLNSMLVHARSWEKILQVVETHFDDFNAVNLITALHRLATVVLNARKGQLRRDVRFKRMIHRLSDTLRNADSGALKPQDLSNVAWALTKLGLLNAVLFGHIAEHIMRTISDFEPVNLSMTLWAFARSGFLDEKLFRVASTEVHRQLPEFQPQQIANTTWAMAKSGFVDEELFNAAAQLALQKLGEFQPMNYSMLLYSFALAKLPHPQLFEEVGQRCTISSLSSALSAPHVVTNLALAYSEAGVPNLEVFDAVAVVASNTLYDFRTQQIATLAHAFAHAQVRHEKFFESVSKAVVRRLAEFKHHDLQDLLSAYEQLGLSTTTIAKAVEAQQWQDQPSSSMPWLAILAIAVLVMVLVATWHSHIADAAAAAA